MSTDRAVEDRLDVTDVLLRYFRGLDRADAELVRSCFADDAHLDYPGSYSGDTPGFVDWVLSPAALGSCTRTVHFAGNILVDIDGDVAHSEVYAMAHHTTVSTHPWAGLFVTMWIRYLDELGRVDDKWQIVRRTVAVEWVRKEPNTLEEYENSPARRDRSDPAYWR